MHHRDDQQRHHRMIRIGMIVIINIIDTTVILNKQPTGVAAPTRLAHARFGEGVRRFSSCQY